MNDFQMSFLANDHRQDLLNEAKRQRQARDTHESSASGRRPRRRRASGGRIGSSLLFGRVVLF